ncbi:MAG: hypothetical protein OXF11_13265 [Deltaproteobacteria bacterium]|nr:hypothetical protein [Deltaproteobacteria bacterium]
MKDKINTSVEIERAQREWLEAMTEKYQIADASKALRIVLDHARTATDEKALFETVRCLGCG